MKGLIIKDIINTSKSIKIFLALTVLYSFMSYMQEDATVFTLVIIFVFSLQALSTFSYDDLVKWDSYALTMPISKDDIVFGKYTATFLLILIGVLFGLASSLVTNLFLHISNILPALKLVALGTSLSILFYSILMPIIIKFGVEKARFLIVGLYVIPIFLGFLIHKEFASGALTIPDTLIRLFDFCYQNIYIIVPICLVIVTTISYLISIKIYQKKEF